jgi:amino acid transporter
VLQVVGRAKRALFGRPLASDRLDHERLSKTTGLAVLSSDAISSVAYATDQILIALSVLGAAAAIGYVVPISAAIVALLVLVGVSYQQTIRAYPSGGGSYTVARENLGTGAGLVAAASLLTDYVLTVSVSVAGGVAAITSAYPSLDGHAVALGIGCVTLLMIGNLRGVRESGIAFSVPTYVFIVMMVLLIGIGAYRTLSGNELAVVSAAPSLTPAALSPITGGALLFLLLRGFAEGCVAMTGTEAISIGITAFRQPAQRIAAITLAIMVALLAVFFLGASSLAHHYAIMPRDTETVLSQVGRRVFGGGVPYYILQYSTFALLVLAANTAFNDFPRLSSILAKDHFLPNQMSARGDRLAFSNGIVILAITSALLLWVFRGETNALIPLYAVGVFICFTLSQAGMVKFWRRTRASGWRWRATLNGFGAVATGIVAVIQVVTKFSGGAWIVVVVIPLLIVMLRGIHRHYMRFWRDTRFDGQSPILPLRHAVVVPVNRISKATAAALVYASTISDDVVAVAVEVDAQATAELRARWEAWDVGIPLLVLSSPFRSVLKPLVAYVDSRRGTALGDLVTVVVPEVVPRRWWEHLLHNKTALYIRTAFLFKPNVVVTAIPYLVRHGTPTADAPALELAS